MRLTKLKLAGFKSFVDPTSVSLPGQLVGVVGPNGCGKSNIMDAVRWVLGDQGLGTARRVDDGRHLQRFVEPQAGIACFRRADLREPARPGARPVVAIHRTVGQARADPAGQSDYFINNLKVRRRTSPISSSAPASAPCVRHHWPGHDFAHHRGQAGRPAFSSKRRPASPATRNGARKRGGRLEDTRENLLRVEDIREELGHQIERLESQAEVARRYHALNQQLTQRQQLLWLLRKREAESERQRLALEVERATTDLEAQSAALRETEARAEETRGAFAAGDALHNAQSEMYAANAEVARLEAEIRHRRESRSQLEARLVQLEGELAQWTASAEKLAEDRLKWEEAQEITRLRVEEAEERLHQQMNLAPQVEEDHAQAQEELQRLRTRSTTGEQKLEVELTNKSHAQRALQAIVQRRERLREGNFR